MSPQRRRRLAFAVAGWTVTLALVAPFLWMVLGSFKTTVDFLAFPPVFVFAPTLENYRQVLADNSFLQYTLNSTIVAAGATLIGLLLGVPAAYALARYRRTGIGVVLLLARMAPGIAFLIPLFVMFLQLEMVGSYTNLIASHLIFTLPLTVWMMYAYFRQLPRSLEEAALVDGLSRWQTLWIVAVPLAAPGMAAAAVFCFIAVWPEFFFALILTSRYAFTLPTVFRAFLGFQGSQYGEAAALAATSLLPSIALGMLVQRHLVRGLTLGAIRG